MEANLPFHDANLKNKQTPVEYGIFMDHTVNVNGINSG